MRKNPVRDSRRQSSRHLHFPAASFAMLAGLLLLSSCAHPGSWAARSNVEEAIATGPETFWELDRQEAAREQQQQSHANPRQSNTQTGLVQTAAVTEPTASAALAGRSEGIVQVAGELIAPPAATVATPGVSPGVLTGPQPSAQPGTVTLGMTEAVPTPCPPPVGQWPECPPSAAMPYAANCQLCPPVAGVPFIPVDPRQFPDEYLCDGGDREHPVSYGQNMRSGLDTEDTVAEFLDHTGKFHVQPTNRVCVYAPRFASMTTIEAPTSDVAVRSLASASRADGGRHLRGDLTLDSKTKDLPARQIDVRSRLSAMQNTMAGVGVQQQQRGRQFTHLLSGHFVQEFLGTGVIREGSEAWLAESLTAAAQWSKADYPIIGHHRTGTAKTKAVYRLEELIGTDVKGPGELRIVKLADKQAAQVGDVITFSLRYDNVGQADLLGIRIVDNLTPRLEFIPNSETSDRPGTLTVEDNTEGSLLLTFELDDPLPAKTGGVITFQVRVR